MTPLPGPDAIEAEAYRLWDSGRLLRAFLGVEALFPWSLSLGCPRGGHLPEDLAGVRAWKGEIEAGCKCAGGDGYRIEYREIGHVRLPERVVFDTPMDMAGYLGKMRELGEFARLAREIRGRFPALRGWIESRPLQLLEYRAEWPALLEVLEYCVTRPDAVHRLDGLDVAGVDAGLVARRKQLLAELLERVGAPV